MALWLQLTYSESGQQHKNILICIEGEIVFEKIHFEICTEITKILNVPIGERTYPCSLLLPY
jgi:hypothetical protein